MAKLKQTFVADDGKEFATEAEADGHNKTLQEAAAIDAYCEAVGLQKAQRGLLMKHIGGFLAFRETYVPPPAVETRETGDETQEPATV